ncbi:hypothetical protein [Pseudomonas sp. I2]|uniref:hypothetical protein n=1 Tax=unclassified Pseudomonas TaxID=196821 RepID=UPI0034D407EE
MVRIRPLSFLLALGLGIASTASLAATDVNGTGAQPQTEHASGDHSKGSTAGEGSSTNTPGGTQGNDSSDSASQPDAVDGRTGGSGSTGEATGSGAGSSGGTAEDQDSR